MTAKPIILVTGSNGQLGMELRASASAVDDFEFVFTDLPDFDITHPAAVNTWFEKHRPSWCINTAAYTAVDKAEEPAEKEIVYKVNATAPGLLAQACADNHCRLIQISTDYVFDGMADVPYTEESAVNPQGVYAASKLNGEQEVMAKDKQAIIIRTSWLYSVYGKNFVKTMIRLMQEKESIGVVSDQLGCPTWAADLASAIMRMISYDKAGKKIPGGIYHFCNAGVTSWYEFAKAIKSETGSNCRVNAIPTSSYPTPAKRPAYSALDTSKIARLLDFKPVHWQVSLQKCMANL